MKPPLLPGQEIGSTDAATVNEVSRYLSDLVRRNDLPQKLLVVHRFTRDMIQNEDQLERDPGVALVVNVDGFGDQPNKISKYREFTRDLRRRYNGFKLFYHEDLNLMSPKQVLRLRPNPIWWSTSSRLQSGRMTRPVLLAVDDDPAAPGAVERELRERYSRDYAVLCEESCAAALRDARAAAGRGSAGRARAVGPVAVGDDRRRAARPGAPAPPARQAWSPDRVGRLGRPAHRRGDPRGDGARPDRLLRAAPVGTAGRGVPPGGVRLPARVVALAEDRPAHDPRRRRSRGPGGRTRSATRSSAARSRTPSAWPTPSEGREVLAGRRRAMSSCR